MGIVLSKFWKKNSTEALLEKLQKQIQALEKSMINTEQRMRWFVTNFVGFGIALYIVGLGIGYFLYFPTTAKGFLVYLVSLLLVPLVIILLRRLFTWFFQGKLNKKGDKLAKLKGDKRVLLEEVMAKETYKVALNLLERFDEKKEIRLPTAAAIAEPEEEEPKEEAAIGNVEQPEEQVVAVPAVRRRTPFPIVADRSRSAMDRLVDFIVGDGPQNRFGMICKECYAHNGMVSKEEYEYVAFQCATCNALNEARKVRPMAPRLQIQEIPGLEESYN